jgi:hypothetical protein
MTVSAPRPESSVGSRSSSERLPIPRKHDRLSANIFPKLKAGKISVTLIASPNVNTHHAAQRLARFHKSLIGSLEEVRRSKEAAK